MLAVEVLIYPGTLSPQIFLPIILDNCNYHHKQFEMYRICNYLYFPPTVNERDKK